MTKTPCCSATASFPKTAAVRLAACPFATSSEICIALGTSKEQTFAKFAGLISGGTIGRPKSQETGDQRNPYISVPVVPFFSSYILPGDAATCVASPKRTKDGYLPGFLRVRGELLSVVGTPARWYHSLPCFPALSQVEVTLSRKKIPPVQNAAWNSVNIRMNDEVTHSNHGGCLKGLVQRWVPWVQTCDPMLMAR